MTVTVTYAGRRLVTHTQFEHRGRVRRFTCQEAAPKSHNFLIVATRTSNELIRVCCLLLFWFAFSPCESKRIRLRTHHHYHHQHHQINIKWTYRLQLFYATLPSGFSCCVFFRLLPRATRDNCTREGTRPTRTVPASLPHPHPHPHYWCEGCLLSFDILSSGVAYQQLHVSFAVRPPRPKFAYFSN